MEQMLQFNPYFRPSAVEILENKLFDNFRNDEKERSIKKVSEYQVFLPVDSDDAFDYENTKNAKYSIQELKNLLV